jgi:hypothetical protein
MISKKINGHPIAGILWTALNAFAYRCITAGRITSPAKTWAVIEELIKETQEYKDLLAVESAANGDTAAA